MRSSPAAASRPVFSRWVAPGWIAGLGVLVAAAASAQVTFTGLGYHPANVLPVGISSDGAVMAASTVGFGNQAVRWTAGGSYQPIGSLGPFVTDAHGMSADGTVIVGSSRLASNDSRAYRWVQGSGMTNLGTLPGDEDSHAWGVSADGSVVVGVSTDRAGNPRAFRWTAGGGLQSLADVDDGTDSHARGVSADGAVIVGSMTDPEGLSQAFRWTAATGLVGLGLLEGASYSDASAVSADGSVIIGDGGTGAPFRWTAGTGLQSLALLENGFIGSAYALSADGRIAGGWSDNFGADAAVLWDETGAVYDLQALLQGQGVDLTNWALRSVSAIGGADGVYHLAGIGQYEGVEQAFVVTGLSVGSAVPEPSAYAALVGLVALAGALVLRRQTARPSATAPSTRT